MPKLQHYHGSCHCGAVQFDFSTPTIELGIRCNCSVCEKKGITMSDFNFSAEEFTFVDNNQALSVYSFASHTAKHYFCKTCGVYPFHQMFSQPGRYRINLGCVDGLDTLSLPIKYFDGVSL